MWPFASKRALPVHCVGVPCGPWSAWTGVPEDCRVLGGSLPRACASAEKASSYLQCAEVFFGLPPRRFSGAVARDTSRCSCSSVPDSVKSAACYLASFWNLSIYHNNAPDSACCHLLDIRLIPGQHWGAFVSLRNPSFPAGPCSTAGNRIMGEEERGGGCGVAPR